MAWVAPSGSNGEKSPPGPPFIFAMYLLYVDASGSPQLGGDRDLYVSVGVCIHEGTWFALERRLEGLRRRYMHQAIEFEFHSKDFCVSISEQDAVPGFEGLDWDTRRAQVQRIREEKLKSSKGDDRRQRVKKYNGTHPFIHLTRKERRQLYVEALDLIGSHNGLVLFGEVCDKSHLLKKYGEVDAVKNNFTQLVTRFNAFVGRQNDTSGTDRRDKGIIVMDNEPTHEAEMSKLMGRFRSQGHPWGELEHVIENPFFVDSSSAMAVQAADICAYAVRRYVERAHLDSSHEYNDFMRLFHKFDRRGPRLDGIRH